MNYEIRVTRYELRDTSYEIQGPSGAEGEKARSAGIFVAVCVSAR
jgi:hypothetical protein